MTNLAALRRCLEVLHYLTPFGAALVAVVFSTIYACILPPSKLAQTNESRRSASKWLTLAITLSYAGEGFLYVARSLIQDGWYAAQDTVAYVMGSVFVWGCMFTILTESSTVNWTPYDCSWIVGTGLQGTVLILSIITVRREDRFDNVRLAIQLLRMGLLFILCSTGFFLKIRQLPEVDTERQPLLEADRAETETETEYGALTARPKTNNNGEAEPEDRDKKFRESQAKRIEEQGGWLGYLKEFLIFIPYIWPSKQRKLQFFMVLIILELIAERILNIMVPRQLGIVVDALTRNAGSGRLPWKEIGTWMLLAFLDSRVIHGLKQMLEYRLTLWANVNVTRAAFRHLMGLSMEFHDNKDSGELIQAVHQSSSLTSLLTMIFFDTGPVFLDVIVAVAYVTNLFDQQFAWIVVVVGTVYILVTFKLTNWNASRRRYCTEKARFRSRVLYESISNWQTRAYFNREEYEELRFGKALDEQVKGDLSYYNGAQIMLGTQELVMLFGRLGLCFMAAYRVSQGVRPVGSFVTLNSLWGTLSWPLYMLAHTYKQVNQSLIDAERLLQLLQTKSTVFEKPGAPSLKVVGGKVDFSDVKFAYDERKQTINGMSFTAHPGSTVALVGETGSGKSTTLKLLFRFYDVSAGSITIDQQDIRDIKIDSLRESIGVVPQDPSLFNISIIENVRYARLDATDEEVQDACKAASIHDKILTFPDGYNTKVGERGVKLSGGELQRVSIARVFLKNPQIVVLDEATSAIDSSTEAQIQEAFRKLSMGRTTFVIAHRLSTIMDADLILVVDKGEIVERGTHNQLLQQHGKYVELWTKQTSKNGSSSNSSDTVGGDTGNELIPDLDAATSSHTNEASSVNMANEPSILDQVDGQSESKHMKGSNPKRSSSFRKNMHDIKERFRGRDDEAQDEPACAMDDPTDNAPLTLMSPRPTDATVAKPQTTPKVHKRRSKLFHPGSTSSESQAPRQSRTVSDGPKMVRRSSIPIAVSSTPLAEEQLRRRSTADPELVGRHSQVVDSLNDKFAASNSKVKQDEDGEVTDDEPSIYQIPHATPGNSVKKERKDSI